MNNQHMGDMPDFNAKASAFTKLVIAMFFVSFFYMVFTSTDGEPKGGWIGIIAFLVAGIMTSSILIAAPFFFLKQKFPKFSILITLGCAVVTFLITKKIFLLLLT